MGEKLGYRADIDGLRAVSVIAVLLFHAKVPGFSGGYVGVDVFFVISGFLITSLLLAEQRAGCISFFGFYERRIRRLLPAALPVLVATFVLSYLFFLPKAFLAFSESLTAFFAFSSNFYFLGQAGYFDAPSETKPLLHMWSLSIEEQYYLVFPALISVLFSRQRNVLFYSIVALLVMSLAVSQYHVAHDEKTWAFFGSFGRIWELLVGSLCAFLIGQSWVARITENRAVALMTRGAGLALIFYAIFAFSPDSAFPGLLGLVPTLGAALVILAGWRPQDLTSLGFASSGLASLGLASGPVVYVGRLSYSLYLWHWPVIVFSGLYHPEYDTPRWIGAGVLSLFLSAISYHFIETPFRKRRVLSGQKPMYAALGLSLLAMVPAAGFVIATDGYPARLPAGIAKIEAGYQRYNAVDRSCDKSSKLTFVCRLGKASSNKGAPVDVVVVGDSHAGMLEKLIDFAGNRNGFSGASIWRGNCPPLVDIARAGNRACIAAMKYALERIKEMNPKVVVLNSVWPLYWYGTIPGEPDMPPVYMAPFRKRAKNAEESAANVVKGFNAFLDQLGARKLLIVLPMPLPSAHVSNEMRRLILLGLSLDQLAIDEEQFAGSNAAIAKALSGIAKVRHAAVFDPRAYLCSEGVCDVQEDGYPLYQDTNHLSDRGLHRLETAFETKLVGVLRSAK